MALTNSFRAVYCSGLLIPNQSTVAALGLLFEKVYLPNNIEHIVDFVKIYQIKTSGDRYKKIKLEADSEEANAENPLNYLSPEQQENAYKYLDWCMGRAIKNHELFGEVIECNAFGESGPLHAELIELGTNGNLNKYKVTRVPMSLTGGDHDELSTMIEKGYVPVVGKYNSGEAKKIAKGNSAKQLAATLAIKSVEMMFPATKEVPAEVILEARDKLKDQLPLLWSSMFKLSLELKKAIAECDSPEEISAVGTDIIDTLVRPAIVELNHKIELERKQWFRRIFGSFYQSLRVAAANPPLTPDQLIKSSLMLGADTAMNISTHLQQVEAMKSQVGLTYLIDLSKMIEK